MLYLNAIVLIELLGASYVLFRLYTKYRTHSLFVSWVRRLLFYFGNTMKKMRTSSTSRNDDNVAAFKFTEVEPRQLEDCIRPTRRSGHRAICNKSDLYIWGGYCPLPANAQIIDPNRSPLFPELWRFNYATSTWDLLKTTGDIPSSTVASPSVILHGSKMIVYGGTGFPFGRCTGESIYVCDLKTLDWKRLGTTGDALCGLYGSSLVLWKHFLYILYGTTSNEYCSNVYKINMNTLEVVKLFDSMHLIQTSNHQRLEELENEYPDGFIYGRYRQEVVLHNDQIFTFGGSKMDGQAFGLDILPVFDLKTEKWKFVQTEPDLVFNTYPDKRKFHSCLKSNNDVYVFGGVYYTIGQEELSQVENRVWKLDLNTLKWKKLKIKMPKNTFFHASAITSDGVAFFHGGVSSVNSKAQRINNLYRINLNILKLKEICWENLVNSYENLVNLDKAILYKIGIPDEFIERIE